MKIAIVSQPIDTILPPYQNSIGYYSWNLALQLARSHEVIVYGLQDQNPQPISPRAGSPELCSIRASRSDRAAFRARRKIGQLIQISSPVSTSEILFPDYGRRVAEETRRGKFDVIHVQHCSQYLPIIRALNPAARIILHLHAEWFTQSNFGRLRGRLRHADRIFAVSDHINQKTRADFPEAGDRVETVYCGIDVQEFAREKNYTAARNRRERRILYCGAVSPHKGPHVLLDSFRMVAARHPEVHLEFIGSMGNYPIEENFDMSDRESLQRIAPYYARHPLQRIRSRFGMAPRDAGTYQASLRAKLTPDIAENVIFRGFIDRSQQIERYYESDIFAFPPVWEEGCGIPPIEAMAAGLPVAGTRSGGLLETVQEGETGFLVEKNDAAALARQILRLVQDDDLRERMGRAARRHALNVFSWERIAGQVEAQYQAALLSRESCPGTAVDSDLATTARG